MTIVAAAQLDTQDDPDASFARAAALAESAAARGARVVAFPENFLDESLDRVLPLEPWLEKLRALARRLTVAIVAGTVREPGDGLPFQTTFVFDASGAEVHRYRKIHLFDVDVPGGARERESERLRPGPIEAIRAFDLAPLGACGVGICYDLRFPELWRALAPARVLFAPSSFALGTGKDHWQVLLRARAIENQAWVVAPAQSGTKPGGRARFGHASIVDPWGTVVADAGGEGEGLAIADVDLAFEDRVRERLPALRHRRI